MSSYAKLQDMTAAEARAAMDMYGICEIAVWANHGRWYARIEGANGRVIEWSSGDSMLQAMQDAFDRAVSTATEAR